MSEEFDVNLDEKVVVKNTASWDLHFARIESAGDIEIKRKGTLRLTNGEIQSQIHAGNVFFIGTDGKGSHARLFIDSQDTRIFVGFESPDGEEKQFILNIESVKTLINLPIDKFKNDLDKYVVTQAEKLTVIEIARELKLNDFEKIKILEDYTGFKFAEEEAKVAPEKNKQEKNTTKKR